MTFSGNDDNIAQGTDDSNLVVIQFTVFRNVLKDLLLF